MNLHTPITGILVTGKTVERYPLARRAVESWLRQLYFGERELLIINDHPTEALFPGELPPHVREVRLTDQRYTLGELRNIGMVRAHCDYCVQWDDDDYSSNSRLAWQVEHTKQGKASIFRYEVHCDLTDGNAFVNDGYTVRCHGFPGTMMWPRDTKVRFPSLGKAEDTEFVLALESECGVDVLKNDPLLYCRFYTGNNTWSQKHIMKRKPGARDLTDDERRHVQQLVSQIQQRQ